MVLFGFAEYNTAELDFMSFILCVQCRYNAHCHWSTYNETIYYGRADSVLKKEKKFPRPIHIVIRLAA